MKTPHKHAELIKAWADGAEIEFYCSSIDKWLLLENPKWHKEGEYRIKSEPKLDVIYFANVCNGSSCKLFQWLNTRNHTANIQLTFCGETGNLKAAEVL